MPATHDYFVADQRGLSAYLERDGKALPDRQFLREFTQNGFDSGATEIMIDTWVDPVDDALKLRVSDNGEGMNESQLQHHIKTLMVSGAGRRDNYGVGARIASLARNPYGVTWASKVAGSSPWQVRASKGHDGYGLEKFQTDRGESAIYAPDKGILGRPVTKAGHGTSVVIHGKTHGEETGSGLRSAATYLSYRYWAFPPGAQVKVVSNGTHPVLPSNILANRDAVHSGTVELTAPGSELPALLRWYVLAPGSERRTTSGSAVYGRLAMLHDNELFAPADESALLQRFGIGTRSARSKVVLVIEPIDGVSMNTQRTNLVRPYGKSMPWGDWAWQFNKQMPEEISDLVRSTTPSHKLDELVAKHVPGWQKLLMAQRLMRPVRGATQAMLTGEAEEALATGPNAPGEAEPTEVLEPEELTDVDPEAKADPVDDAYRRHPQEPKPSSKLAGGAGGETRMEQVEEFRLPSVDWVDASEWVGGPAWITFTREANLIQLRSDMPAARSRIQEVMSTREDVHEDLVREAVRSAYAVEAATSVLTILNLTRLQGSLRYTREQVDHVLEPMNLTATLAGMQSIDAVISMNLKELAR